MLNPSTQVPTELVHARFVATPLTGSVAALDYAAYLASPDVVSTHSAGRWPVAGFTFALLAPGRDESLNCMPVLSGETRPYLWYRRMT